jgi:hypothetical protein
MRLPRMSSVIERRLLVKYRVDPDALRPLLPGRFRRALVDGAAELDCALVMRRVPVDRAAVPSMTAGTALS